MKEKKIRRMPISSKDGRLIGIVAEKRHANRLSFRRHESERP